MKTTRKNQYRTNTGRSTEGRGEARRNNWTIRSRETTTSNGSPKAQKGKTVKGEITFWPRGIQKRPCKTNQGRTTKSNVRQADGTYQISPDQYKACVLAIAPLQKLWVKAGEHDLQHCFGAPALGRSFQRRFGQCLQSVAEVLKSFLFAKGQVIYYAQAVDLVHQKEYFADQSVLRECLSITNMVSKTCNLMAFVPLHVGLRVKITKKLMAPELVQECPAEIVAIHVHPDERCGIPGCPPGLSQPPLGHPCWTEGICRLDYLPANITIRVEDRGDDYTGEGLPGIWHLDPCEDEISLANSSTWGNLLGCHSSTISIGTVDGRNIQ